MEQTKKGEEEKRKGSLSLVQKEDRDKLLYVDFVEITDIQSGNLFLKGSLRLFLTSCSLLALLKSIKEFCVFTVMSESRNMCERSCSATLSSVGKT